MSFLSTIRVEFGCCSEVLPLTDHTFYKKFVRGLSSVFYYSTPFAFIWSEIQILKQQIFRRHPPPTHPCTHPHLLKLSDLIGLGSSWSSSVDSNSMWIWIGPSDWWIGVDLG